MSEIDPVLERRRARSEIVKNWVEVIGLLVGGGWILLTFGLRECPTRKTNFEPTADFSWDTNDERCTANWHLALKNISSGIAEVNRVRFVAWTFDPPAPSGDAAAFVDLDALRPKGRERVVFERWFDRPDDPFVYDFPPNGMSAHMFELIFQRPSKPTYVVFEIELYRAKDDPPIWRSFDWSPICGDTPAR